MNFSPLSRYFYQLSRYIHHTVAWRHVLFHAVNPVACGGVLFCPTLCCHLLLLLDLSCCCMPSRVVACPCACHLLLPHAVRGSQAPSCIAAAINIWGFIVLITIFQIHWKKPAGESVMSYQHMVPRGWWNNLPSPVEAAVRPYGMVLKQEGTISPPAPCSFHSCHQSA